MAFSLGDCRTGVSRRVPASGPRFGAARGAVDVLSPVPRDVWNAVWDVSREATIFHRREWLEACCESERFDDASRLYETADGGRIVLPLVKSRDRPRARQESLSMPVGWGLGGAFGSRPLRRDDVALILEDILTMSPRLVISPGPVNGNAWMGAPAHARVRHDAHVVNLGRGFDALWSKVFSSDTRNKVRKAEKRGVEVEWGPGTELIRVHHEIYLRWARQQAEKRGRPVPVALALAKHREPLVRYESIARHLGERCQIGLARVDGQPAASVIALLGGVHAHYWRATSDQALVRHRYANHLLLARMLERAAAGGSDYVHMGESGGKRSLIEFKEHFAAEPVSYDELRFGPATVIAGMRARERVIRGAERVAVRGAAEVNRARLARGKRQAGA
jgi:hypothetical protein